LERIPFMFRFSANKISLAASALLLCAGFAQAQTPPASPLTATPSSVGIGFTLPTTQGAAQNTALSITTGSAPFVIDPTTVPFWLATQNSGGASLTSGTVTAGSPLSVYFQATSAAGSMPEGAYVAYVGFAVNGYSELVVSVTLTVTGSASTLTVLNNGTAVTNGGAAVNVPWTYGSAAPTLNLTVLSSSAPITFSAKSTVTASPTEDWIELPNPSGVAYNYGGSLQVNFALDALTNSSVGSTLTGAVTLTYGSGSTFVVNVTVTIGEPAATITSIFPREIAPQAVTATTGTALINSTALTVASATGIAVGQLVTGTGIAAGTTVSALNGTAVTLSLQTTAALSGGAVNFVPLVTVVVTGTGFGDVLQNFTTATTVSLTYGTAGGTTTTLGSGALSAGAVNFVNPTTMILTIPAQDSTPVEVLTTSGKDVVLNITNGSTFNPAGAASIPLYVTSNPIINSIVDAAALLEPAAGATQNVAPYEMVSIFGDNFCPTCTTPVVAPVSADRYPASLNAPASGGNPLSVTFYKSDGTTVVGVAYLLFASNTQINALVPSAVAAADNPMLVVVDYNSVLSNANLTYSVNAAAANPGIFTTSSNGQGQGAILNSNGTVNNSTNQAPAGSTVMIYLSGLGAPTSTAADTAATAAAKYPASCISIASYVTKAALSNPATADGALLAPADIETNLFPPCMAAPAVTIGGKTAAVTYAGWVSDSVAGLYQINATVPSGLTAGNYPVVVTVTTTVGTAKVSASSQAGVTVAVN
jgi:uncharacterized protein (TIGR03437 family)